MTGPADVTIRAAGPSDVPALARLRYEFRAAIDPPTEPEAAFLERCERWMTERLSPDGSWRCWVAEVRSEMIGAVWLRLLEKLPNPTGEPEQHAYVSSLYVRPAHRGAGIGSALLAGCLGECDARAVDAVILWPTPESRSLYERHGFGVRQDLLERRKRK